MADQRSIRRILTTMQNTVQGLTGPSQGTSALQQQQSVKSGWLKKQGGIVKSWHNRWFALKGDQLYYYSSQDESKPPLGTIFLPGNKVNELPSNPNEPDKFLFEVAPGGDRNRMTMTHDTYPICASSDDERKSWVLAIKKVLYAFKGGAIFGQSIEETMAYENTVSKRKIPEIVDVCIDFLRMHGLDVEGIFRLPGRSSVIKRLREEFDCGERPEFCFPEVDVHSVASLLKLYLRELPSPLIPVSFYEAVIKIVTRDFHQNPDEALIALGTVLEQIPRHNYNLLQYLCFFLYQVSVKVDVNKMNCMNLATVFVQNNIIQPEDNDAVLLMGTANGRTQVAFILINCCEQLFKFDYNEQGASIQIDNLVDLNTEERSLLRDTGSVNERQSASQLLDIDQHGNLPSPLAPVFSSQVSEPNHTPTDCTEEKGEDLFTQHYSSEPGDAPNADATVSSTSTIASETNDNSQLVDVKNEQSPPDAPEVTETPDPAKALLRPTRPAPIPRKRTSKDRVLSTTSEGIPGDRRSVMMQQPESARPPRPLRAPPPPPTAPPKTNNTPPAEVLAKANSNDGSTDLLDVNVDDFSREELLSYIGRLRSGIQQERQDCQQLQSAHAVCKEQQKQQVLEFSKKLDEEKTATANAVQRIIQLQNELQQFTLKHGNLV